MIRTLSQAEHKQGLELKKQFYVIFGAGICVLKELHGFSNEKILKILNEADRIMHDWADPRSRYSLPELCEKETGIVLKKGKQTYKDIYMLNSEEWWQADEGLTDEVKKANIIECMPWIPQIIEAALLTAMHRKVKWGKSYRGNDGKLTVFLNDIDGVRAECRTADYYRDLMLYNYSMDFTLRD